MNVKPIVLIIDNSIDVTGALKSITRTAFDLKEHFDFHFIIPKRSNGRFWIEGKGLNNIIELPMKEISKRFVSWLLYFPYLLINAVRLQRLVNKKNISLIHVNDLYNLLPVAIKLFGNKTPYICHIRFMPDRFPRWLFNGWLSIHLRYAESIIAVSENVRKQLPSHHKIMWIPNELPVEERYPELVTLPNNKIKYTFLYLSHYITGKGQNFALDAFAKISPEFPKWKLRFVGGDMGLNKNTRYKRQLMAKSDALGITNRIEWAGFTEEVEWEYKQADVVLNFSESESFSITCLEALFFGRPVIATACGGPEEIIDHGVTGLIVPNRNVDAMAAAMKRMAEQSALREKMGLLAREQVRAKFSVANTSLKLKEVYDRILSGR
jgi:glycosyltransferase involved in cell wall biosynthesis